jgi:hypothetical protein
MLMEDAAFMRDQAARYREMADRLAETIADPDELREILELAAICDLVASDFEDRFPGG